MKRRAVQSRPHQSKAINAIQNAVDRKQKHILVEMASGSGKSIVLLKTLENLFYKNDGRILIIAGSASIKEQLLKLLFVDFKKLFDLDEGRIEIETVYYTFKHPEKIGDSFEYIIPYDIQVSEKNYEMLCKNNKTIIVFSEHVNKYSQYEDLVFSYSYQDGVRDGIFSPVADPSLYEYAVKGFCQRLLEKFNFKYIEKESLQRSFWDFYFSNDNKNIWVCYKNYKSKDVSPNTFNTVIKNAVWNREKDLIPKDDIVMLIIFGSIPKIDKTVLYSKYRIVVWDISNLIFYTANDIDLSKQLSQLTYFKIGDIDGKESESWNFTIIKTDDPVDDPSFTTIEYINKLKTCKSGKNDSRKYEEVCEEIIRYLFSDTFYHMSSQHKTKDKHFRMDLICSFKAITESTHPFWQLLSRYYNTQFVVFEFKNYGNKIDQNLIYTTEKYLFNPALRNVAIIISRKGFSEAATFAAMGCLKEHGKLILNITDDDLIKMLEAKGNEDDPTTLLMEKFEDFLMSISK